MIQKSKRQLLVVFTSNCKVQTRGGQSITAVENQLGCIDTSGTYLISSVLHRHIYTSST